MTYIPCKNEVNCGRYMQILAIEMEYIKKAWVPYCREEISYKKLESIRKEYNKRIKLLIVSFKEKSGQG